MLAHALLAFVTFETTDYLHLGCEVPVPRLQATWADLVRRMISADGAQSGAPPHIDRWIRTEPVHGVPDTSPTR